MPTPHGIRAAFISAAEQGDVQGILGCYAADAVVVAPEGRFEGREQIGTFFGQQFGAISDIRLRIVAQYDRADTGVAEWTFAGTSTGPLELPDGQVLPATGGPVTQRGADIFAVTDGRISEHRLYYDQAELVQQLTPPSRDGR